MSHDIQIRSGHVMPDVADPLVGTSPGGEPMESIFSRVHRLLRGRYRWAISLGCIFAAAGGYAGFKSTEPLWTCTGQVQIKMGHDVVLSNSPENQNTQSPDVIKETQIALMRNQRIIGMAMGTPEWTSLGRPLSDESVAEFNRKLTIVSQGRSEMINVSFMDSNQVAASAAVKGVLGAYNGIYVEDERKSAAAKRQRLLSRQDTLIRDRDAKRDQIKLLANNNRWVGADDLRSVHQARVAELTKLESAMADLKMTISALDTGGPTTRPIRKSPADMTVAEIEQIDTIMRQLRHELGSLERDAQVKLTTLGPRNPRYEEVRLLVELKKDEILNYATEWRAAAAANAQASL